MESPGVYKVVIESSNGQDRYLKEYIGPATGEDHAVEQARTVFKERPDDRLVKVETIDREAWADDTVYLPPDGDEGVGL
ncbi:MAG: hypothetical protein M3317_02475 [Actinomycetota bacterium]|nr:hypothetical protein [Actinomycetota bacterium]